MSAVADSNAERFGKMLEAYDASIRRLAAAYERDPDLRQDLLQDIALALWRALPSFRNQCSEKTFVYRIAHNRAITHAGKHSSFPRDDLDAVSALPDPSPTPEERVSKSSEIHAMIKRVIALPLALRQAAVLALEGLDNQEIASVLGISAGNVAIRLHRARNQLTAGGPGT